MATMWIDRPCGKQSDMPDVCMLCGAEATECVKKKYKWVPPWVRYFGGLPGLILQSIYAKNCTVAVPLCDEHRNHFRNHVLLLWGVFGACMVVAGVLAAVTAMMVNNSDDVGLAFLWFIPALLIWGVCAIVSYYHSIRNDEITEERVKLHGVSDAFVEAYEDWLEEQKGLPRREALERWEDKAKKKPRRDRDEDERVARDDRGRVRDEDDEDDRPRRRSKRDEDEDEDDRPRRRRRSEDDY